MLDVYIGFMDEEAASLLPHLVMKADAENRPLIIFERGDIDNVLFERQIKSYAQHQNSIRKVVALTDLNEVRKVTLLPDRKEELELESLYFNSFSNSINSLFVKKSFSEFKKQEAPAKIKVKLVQKKGEQRQLDFLYSVLGYNLLLNQKETKQRDGIVLVRSPEMGFQPNLIRVYMRAILRSLYFLPGYNGGVRVKVFGASGAIASKDAPGILHEICGSIFVGSEIDESMAGAGADTKKYISVIDLAGFDKSLKFRTASIFRQDGKPISGNDSEEDEKARVEELAREAFGEPRHLEKTRSESKAKLDPGTDRVISLTANFIIDQNLKSTADKTDILHAANMEDYHIFKALGEIDSEKNSEQKPKTDRFNLVRLSVNRVDCDPPIIDSELKDSFVRWCKTAAYTRQTYIAAIQWGIMGLVCDKLSVIDPDKEFEWKWSQIQEVKQENSLFLPYKISDFRGYVLDPFFVEIATDFVKDFASKDKLAAMFRKDKFFNKIKRKNVLKRAKKLVEKLNPKIGNVVVNLLESGALMKEIQAFLDEIFEVKQDNPFILTQDSASDGPKLRIWIRHKSWLTKQQAANEKLNEEVFLDKVKFAPAGIDRALYKSANQVALQKYGGSGSVINW